MKVLVFFLNILIAVLKWFLEAFLQFLYAACFAPSCNSFITATHNCWFLFITLKLSLGCHQYNFRTLCLATRSRVFSKIKMFFSEYGYHPNITGVIGHRKRRFSNTMTSCLGSRLALPHIRFENVTCGVWTQLVLKTEDKVSVFENTRLRVNGQKWFENATFGRRFFWIRRKNYRFRKYRATCGRGLRVSLLQA